jgi:hypothetical protein
MTQTEQTPGASPRAPQTNAMPLAWMAPFLAELDKTGNIRHSARTAGISQTTAYDARHRYPAFDRAWRKAIDGKEYRRGPASLPIQLPEEPEKPAAGRTSHWKACFLEALAETSSVTAAAKRASAPLRTVYKLRRDDPEFAAKWLAALHEGYDHLEMDLLGYLRDPAPRRKMDVAGALRLLAAHRETVERRRALNEEEDEQAVLESIDRFIDEMRVRRDANNAILIETGAGDGAE